MTPIEGTPTLPATHSYSTRDTLAVLSVASALDTHDWVRIASLLQNHALGPLQDTYAYTKEDCQRIYQLAVDESRKGLNLAEATDSGVVLGNALGIAKRRRLSEIQERLRSIDSLMAEIDASSTKPDTENASIITYKEDSIRETPVSKDDAHRVAEGKEKIADKAQISKKEHESTAAVINKDSELEQEDKTDSAPASPVLKDTDAHTEELYMTPEEQPKDVLEEPAADNVSAVSEHEDDEEEETDGSKELLAQQSDNNINNGGNDNGDGNSPGGHSDNQDGNSDSAPLSHSPQNADQGDATEDAGVEEELDLKDSQLLPESETEKQGASEDKATKDEPDDLDAGETDNAIDAQETSLWPKTERNASETPGQPSVIAGNEAASNQSPPVSASSNKSSALTVDEQQLKNWKKNITTVWREISGHRYGGMFIGPIKSTDAPNYYDVIRQPTDLKTIKNRIRDEEITTTVEFYRDIMHMLMNALMYNSEDTEIYQMTMEMIRDAQACIEQLLQTEATVNKPKGGGAAGAGGFGSGSISVARSVSGTPVFGGSGFGHGLGLGLGLGFGDGAGIGAGAGDGGPSAGGAAPTSAATASLSARGEPDTRPLEQHHETEDSDSSLPAKRKRRVASERASKNLRA
ncbi:hypothetical protein GGF39_002293 [Coemansia sp. RSA 1721]|nr:hypothetical protein GGF39_002293 [Coemansia sp. RSA 1721]